MSSALIVRFSITDQLAQGGRVELRGFGAFSTRQRDARVGRNPRTGAAVDVNAKRVPYFKPGKEMRERLNLGETSRIMLTYRTCRRADVAEPVDAGDLKSSAQMGVRVRVPPSAPALRESQPSILLRVRIC